MYPLRINLLSTEKRKYLNKMIYVQFVKNTFISIVFVFCLSGITLLGCQSVLQEYFSDVSNSLTLSDSMHAEKNKNIQAVNETLKKVEAMQEVHNLWSQKIIKLGNAIPTDIIINNILIVNQNKEINISGTALRRTALLELKDNFNNLDFINNINIPLSQLTEKENIDFSISIEMK